MLNENHKTHLIKIYITPLQLLPNHTSIIIVVHYKNILSAIM